MLTGFLCYLNAKYNSDYCIMLILALIFDWHVLEAVVKYVECSK